MMNGVLRRWIGAACADAGRADWRRRSAPAEDGYDLWLRYPRRHASRGRPDYDRRRRRNCPTLRGRRSAELRRGLPGACTAAFRSCCDRHDRLRRRRARACRSPRSATKAIWSARVDARRHAGHCSSPATAIAACSTAPSRCCAICDRRRSRRADRPHVRAAHEAARARPLGQSRWHRRARLCRAIAVGLVDAARFPRPALHRLCPRQRLDRDQRHRPQQRQRQAGQPDRALYRQGGGARRHVPSLWHQGLSVGALLRADRDLAA